ncbi:hypothetical protein BDV36DRAFT_287681 [Aspergillus pseudocaelatus]|uniref:Uncharacterized protein n=1 Tax=Aspergillus pseudocaelatus TaxID=1825620 RepID=A0ABQ6W6Q0_9EURO|nr:hypothetical protein BDV36DRAFT_287681 [Aspergillus pseudocaelatus]
MFQWLTDSYNATISPRSMSPWAIIEVFCDLHFLGYDWILEWSQQNETDDDVIEEISVPIGAMTENRIEEKDALLASLDLKDLKLGIGGEEKYFSEKEIGGITTEGQLVTVRAHSNTFHYQKRYNFRSRLWAVVYAENKLWVAGLSGTTKPSTIDTPFSVMVDEFLAVTTVEAAKLFRMGDYPLQPGSPNLENERIVFEVSQLRARGYSVCTS